MSYFSTSPAARTSLVYITIGALALTWTTVWLVFLLNNPPASSGVYYLVGGCMASGALVLVIGLGLGRIGRAAHKADLEVKTPPAAVASTVVAAPLEATQAAPGTNGVALAPSLTEPQSQEPVIGGHSMRP